MGNNQNSLICAECTAIQIEDASMENSRTNFQMTRLRHFSHYSRDFQVEQKYNRIKQNNPNFSLSVEIIYPENLTDYKDEIILKRGKNKKTDSNEDIVKKQFQVGNLKLNTLIRCQTIESINEECVMDNKSLAERASTVDCFMILIDIFSDFTAIESIVELINRFSKSDALLFLVAAKSSPSASFLEAAEQQPKEYQENELQECNQSNQKDVITVGVGEDLEINEQKINQSSQMKKSNIFKSFSEQDIDGSKSQNLQNHVKNIMESNWNTDFVCIDYESIDNINQKLENMLSQCIYSQDSRIRSTQI